MIFEIISGGEKTDWVGKEWAGLFFPRGKNGPAHSFPGEKTDWGEIPACYTGIKLTSSGSVVGLATDYATGWNQIRPDTLKYLEAGRIHITLSCPTQQLLSALSLICLCTLVD